MIFGIIVLFCFGCAQAAVPWWNLPNVYLDQALVVDIKDALKNAAKYDPLFLPGDIDTLKDRCKAVPADTNYELTDDERAAIACYSFGFVSERVNNALQVLDGTEMAAWSPFLKFFHEGVRRIMALEGLLKLCRGDKFLYDWHAKDAAVRLPVSWTSDEQLCTRFSGEIDLTPSKTFPCTITTLTSDTARYIYTHSTKPGELEFIMLPGTFARVRTITGQQPTKCRIVELYEVGFRDVSRGEDVKHLFHGGWISSQDQQENHFIRDYYQPSFLVSVAKTKRVNIITNGGADDPYNFWPYITNITYGEIGPSNDLRVGQILVRVNEYSTRGMLHHEVEKLIEKVKMDQKAFTNYTVAAR